MDVVITVPLDRRAHNIGQNVRGQGLGLAVPENERRSDGFGGAVGRP